MHLNAVCITNIWRDNIYVDTNLCDCRLTHIIRISKTRTEKNCFTVCSSLDRGPGNVPLDMRTHSCFDLALCTWSYKYMHLIKNHFLRYFKNKLHVHLLIAICHRNITGAEIIWGGGKDRVLA